MSMHDDIKTVLVSEEELKAKVAELGAQISKDYEGKNLVLVSILKGSVVFMADLMRAVSIPCSIDFMVVSSYGGSNTVTSGLVKIIKDLDGDLSGKDVIFYAGSNGKVNHVAIYIGNGRIVHAASRRSGIKTSTWNYRTPVAIRSMLD